MRINKFIANATALSRRAADSAIEQRRVRVNDQPASRGQDIHAEDVVTLDGVALPHTVQSVTILLNKPVDYVVSRDGQGSKTVYDLLPAELHHLKPIGRLDKDSSGLLLMTNDGQLAHELTHPSSQKLKIYEVTLDNPLQPLHRQMIQDHGVMLDDGLSKFQLECLRPGDDTSWKVIMHEGRNRQIRRTFFALGYTVTKLHRTQFGDYLLTTLKPGQHQKLG